MGKRKAMIIIDYSKCSPCSTLICVGVCPMGVLEVGTDGKPQIVDVESCTRCDVCVNLCPTKAITIKQNKQSKE
jgi:NAD-dependent dihydropyrimidine dehydrogenase PreA subunit